MKQNFTVYQITNLINNKIYIGKHKTSDLDDGYMGSGKLLLAAQKKYGIENFKKEILFVFDSEKEMNYKEKEIVTEDFCKRDDTYNLCPGGQGGFGHITRNKEEHRNFARNGGKIGGPKSCYKNLPLMNTEEAKQKRRITQKNNFNNGSIVGGFLGKTHTEETKLKMRKSKNVGASNSSFGTFWITDGKENKKLSTDNDVPNGWRRGRVIKN